MFHFPLTLLLLHSTWLGLHFVKHKHNTVLICRIHNGKIIQGRHGSLHGEAVLSLGTSVFSCHLKGTQMSFVTNIRGRCVTLQLDERAIIFTHCTQSITTNWCDITQGAAITGGMATSFGLGALGFDSWQGQGIFYSSKGSVCGAHAAPYWVGTWGSVPEVMRPESEVGHWLPSRLRMSLPTYLRGGTTLLLISTSHYFRY